MHSCNPKVIVKKLTLHLKGVKKRDAQTIRTITHSCVDVHGETNDFPFYTLTPGIQKN